MPFFADSQNTVFENNPGLQFVEAHGNPSFIQRQYVQVSNNYDPWSDGIRVLHGYIAAGALHNSEERFDAPRCHPETRRAVQNDIMSWICRGDIDRQPATILWVKGPAGTGKSAIKQNIAERCSKDGILAASFFFSYRAPERNHKRHLITTIAYQMAQNIDSAREFIAAAVTKDVSIFTRNLKSQMEALILRPLEQAREKDPLSTWPKVILIDGLDECEGQEHQADILDTFYEAFLSRRLPFRVVFASRPERAMRQFFSDVGKALTREIVLDEDWAPDVDIELLLRSEFNDIRRKYDIVNSGDSQWPGEDVIKTLVENASGQFIYATTILKFIDDSAEQPREHLQQVLDVTITDRDRNPFAPLDALYTVILSKCPDPAKSAFSLQLVQNLCGSWRFSATEANRFLDYEPIDCVRLFGNLHSLLRIPPPENPRGKYQFYHKSLDDFFDDPLRSNHLHVPQTLLHTTICTQYLKHYKDPGPSPDRITLKFHESLNRMSLPDLLAKGAIANTKLPTELARADVKYWVSASVKERYQEVLSWMYIMIHDAELGCRWYRCGQICRTWREQIVHECQQAGWGVPAKSVLLKQDFSQSKPRDIDDVPRLFIKPESDGDSF